MSVGRRMEGEGLCQRKAREWKHVKNERLGEVTERSRGQRDVCMRDQDGGQSNGTRERESSVSETNDYDCYLTKNAST